MGIDQYGCLFDGRFFIRAHHPVEFTRRLAQRVATLKF
jgi:hypothetical protein